MFTEKKEEYKKGRIDKHQYMEDMFNVHKHIFEYPFLINNSPIRKIEITKEQVIFTINNGEDNIMLCCDGRDAYSLPMVFLNLSETETQEQEMILKLIKPGDFVLDIGANIGWYSISILLKNKNGVSVYSFEPIRSSFHYLQQNLKLNNLNSDNAYNIGFSDENKTVQFYFDVEFAMASSMANLREDEDTVTEECTVKRLDDFVSSTPSLERIDFIKCDVEGAELFVFKGAIETIKKDKPIIFTEMLRKWANKFNYHPNQIIYLLKDLGYRCFTIHNGLLKEFFEMDENTVETNFFFLHREKHVNQLLEMCDRTI
jgi:FkbM family methyltransferase